MKQELNEIETKVLQQIKKVAEYYSEDGNFTIDEIDVKPLGITTNQLKGYVGSLSRKGYIEMYGGCYYFDGRIK